MRTPLTPAITVHPLNPSDQPLLWEMLWHARYVPTGTAPRPRDIVQRPELTR